MPYDLRIDDRKLDIFEWLRIYDLLTTQQIVLLDGGSEEWMPRILHHLGGVLILLDQAVFAHANS